MTTSRSSTGMPTAPESEIGKGVASTYDFIGMMPWAQWIDDVERAPDLKWPSSVTVYDQMRNDAQCQGLYLGATAAIMRYIWYIDPNDCPKSWVKLLASDLNLPVGLDAALEAADSGQKRGQLRAIKRTSWYQHLPMALKAMEYGHFYFEQVGEITQEGPGGVDSWRMRKLGPRHPRTITEIKVAKDGGLVSIQQGYGTTRMTGIPSPNAYEIPIDRLVGYVWDQEPGNWVGRSIYRSMYRNWLIKDRLLRVDAIKHERNGVGMPIIEGPEGASDIQMQDLDRMAQEYKVGERGGGAIPFGAKLNLVGTSGSLPNTIESMHFQNEEMARSMLMMFMQLGQTQSGSRALGETFVDWFSLQQEMIAEWIVGIANEYIVGDWWGWNVDPESDRTPLIAWFKPDGEGPMEEDFQGADLPEEIPLDEQETEPEDSQVPAAASRRARVPRARTGDPSPPGGTVASKNGQGNSLVQAPSEGMSAAVAVPQNFRRQLFEHEVRAAADFSRIDDTWQIYTENLLHIWATQIRPQQMAEINSAIASMSPTDLEDMARLSISSLGSDEMYSLLRLAAGEAVAAATSEVISQGEAPPPIRWADIEADLKSRSRAMSAMLAQSLSDTASRYAVRRASASATAQEIADGVTSDLSLLTDAWLKDQLGGVVQAAVNQSRMTVYNSTEDDPTLWASEILDLNTCTNCAAIDGRQLDKTDAAKLYASGGYINCLGRERCRGTVVATYDQGEF